MVHDSDAKIDFECGSPAEKINSESKMEHVNSYIMVAGRLIPSIQYRVKTKIYNRFKIQNNPDKEIITFPSLVGPLKLPNINLKQKI